MALRVLLVEPFFGGSHRAWALGLQRHSRHQIDLVTHDDAFWRWRTRGAAVTLAEAVASHVERHGRPDVLLVSTMVDVAALLGLARRALGDVAVVHDVHENQLTYPRAAGEPVDAGLVLRGWSSLLAADRVVVHSEFHRRELFAALPAFLGSFPDQRHGHLLDEVAAKVDVVPVGIDVGRFAGRLDDPGPPVVVWNHRWEHDKDPQAFADAVLALDDAGVAFRVALAGEATPNVPAGFAAVRDRLGDRLVAFGGLDAERYARLLRGSDLVVSTARQEFFGLAVCEGMAAGACPVLPDRLTYPELLGDDGLRAGCLYGDGQLVAHLGGLLGDDARRAALGAAAASQVRRFDWQEVAPRYDAVLDVVTR